MLLLYAFHLFGEDNPEPSLGAFAVVIGIIFFAPVAAVILHLYYKGVPFNIRAKEKISDIIENAVKNQVAKELSKIPTESSTNENASLANQIKEILMIDEISRKLNWEKATLELNFKDCKTLTRSGIKTECLIFNEEHTFFVYPLLADGRLSSYVACSPVGKLAHKIGNFENMESAIKEVSSIISRKIKDKSAVDREISHMIEFANFDIDELDQYFSVSTEK